MEGWGDHLRALYGSDDLSDAVVLLATPEQAKAARAAQAAAASSAASAADGSVGGPAPLPAADAMLAHGRPIAAHSIVLCMSPVWRATLLSGAGQVDATASGKKVRWRCYFQPPLQHSTRA
jgi:hypothetical protein